MPFFRRNLLTLAVSGALTLSLAACNNSDDSDNHGNNRAPAAAAFSLVGYLAVDGVAEIVGATPNGMALIYTNAGEGAIGLIDITDPAHPVHLSTINVMTNSTLSEHTSLFVKLLFTIGRIDS